jgi:hypothetical protein
VGAEAAGNVHRRESDASSRAEDHDMFPGSDRDTSGDREDHRRVALHRARRDGEVDIIGNGGQRGGRQHDVRRIAAEVHRHGGNRGAHRRDARHVVTDGADAAGERHAGCVGQRRTDLIEAARDQAVDERGRGGFHLDQHLSGAWSRRRFLDHLQANRVRELPADHAPHRQLPDSSGASTATFDCSPAGGAPMQK